MTNKVVVYRRKKTTKRKKQLNGKNQPYSLVNLGNGMPLKCRMVHRYAEYPTLTFTSGAFAQYAYSANGMYDPNSTGAGIQPTYFDTMTGIYNHYTVIGSRMKCTFLPTAVPTVPITVGCVLDDNGTLANNTIAACQSNPAAKWITIPAGDNDPRSIVMNFSAKKIFGGNAMVEELSGTSSANPTEGQFFCFFGQVMTGSSTAAVLLQVDIEYIAIWTELLQTNYN